MMAGKQSVDLGFAEDCEPEAITNRYFPSKVGGKPAWLELKKLPTAEEIRCPTCNEPRIFLCQIYAPIETRQDCFHRTIFVFICRNNQCQKANSAENMVIFRSQLPRENAYYSFDPPEEDEKLPAIPPLVKLCSVCGCHGPLLCSQCKKVSYCSQCHQKIDWKYHKQFCKSSEESKSHSHRILFSEFEIVIEAEPEESFYTKEETEEEAEQRRIKEYEELLKSGKVSELKDVPESEIAQYVSDSTDDKQFRKFKKRVDISPEQILRYEQGGNPLWITSKNIPDECNVPNCESCGSKRNFEFQIMPQLLHILKEDKLDWGVIAIYTCQESCDTKSGYLREFAVKQDIITEEDEGS